MATISRAEYRSAMRPALDPRFRPFIMHPVTALLVGVLCLGALAVVVTTDVSGGTDIPVEVQRAECYQMIYAEPLGGATAEYFPARIILLPGVDSGAVKLEGASSRSTWWLHAKGSTWRTIGPDSIALDLTNGIAHIDVRAHRSVGQLSGRATYRANLAAPVAPPSMRFTGELEANTPTAMRSIANDRRDNTTGYVACGPRRAAAD